MRRRRAARPARASRLSVAVAGSGIVTTEPESWTTALYLSPLELVTMSVISVAVTVPLFATAATPNFLSEAVRLMVTVSVPSRRKALSKPKVNVPML